ncbi:MAG: hypothetical protein FWE01_02220 [Firmicutes bacterium]|nr:hypothetical protein [Bacillota bacterium]
MNAKELKKYELIVKVGATEIQDENLASYLAELAVVDYQTAFEMWEYLLTTHVSRLSDVVISHNIETKVFEVMQRISDAKLRQLLGSNPTILKLVYSSCATAGVGGNLAYLSSLVLASKIDAADEILKLLAANKNNNMDFGDRMKLLIDDVFNTYCSKNNTKVPNLNRKQIMLLLEHTLKVKGANKTLLTQRIKELG